MATLHEIRARLESVEELAGIVRAIRSLAAVRIQQAQEGLDNARDYAAVTEAAVADVLAMLPGDRPNAPMARPKPPRVFVLCSEHGFVGPLNRRLLAHAREIQRDESAALMVIGSRGAALALDHGLDIDWTMPMASHKGGVEIVARRVTNELYRRYNPFDHGPVDLLYPRSCGSGPSNPERRTLFPFLTSPAVRPRAAVPPLRNIPADALFARVVQEHVFAEITLAVIETLASVNKARLMIMQAAYENLDKKRLDLGKRERRVRQEEVTTELFDVVIGAEAIDLSQSGR